MVYPGVGVAVSTGAAWTTSLQVGTSANNLVQLNGSAQLPAVSGVNLTALPSTAVVNNSTNTGTSAMTLDLHSSTVSNAFRVPAAAGLTVAASGALGYDTTANALHAAQNGADAIVALFTATPANGDCVNWVVAGGVTKLGTTGSACGSGGGGSAFGALTSGTNTTAAMVVGTGASISPTGSGAITATALSAAYIDWTAVSGGASILNKPTIPTVTGGTCTNQFVTSVSGTVTVVCNTVTSAYVNTTVATTGVDLDTSSATKVAGLKGVPFCTGFTPTNGQVLEYTTSSSPNPCYTAVSVGGGGAAFNLITGGTNTSAAMVVGTGASITVSGSGAVTATALNAQYIDWSAGSGPTSIANKPTIPTVTGGTCTNQVVTAISSSAVPTCTTIGSAYVNNTIAVTGGTDIDSNSHIIHTNLSSPLPLAQGGNNTATPQITAGSGISISGSWGAYTISATGGGGNVSTGVTLTSGKLIVGAGSSSISTGDLSGYIKTSGSTTSYIYGDIRNYGATCNGTDQNTAVQSALAAGIIELYIPTGCLWVLPHTSWSYNPGSGTILVPADSIPGGLTITGQDWVNSKIQTSVPASYVMYAGSGTKVLSMNTQHAGCQVQNINTGGYDNGASCPNLYYFNASYRFAGTVNTSGTSVSYSTGMQFTYNAGSQPDWTNSWNYLVINGVHYGVSSVASATSLTLSSTAGTQTGAAYSVEQYRPMNGNGYQFISMAAGGPTDLAGIQAAGFGAGDVFYGGANGKFGTAFRGSSSEDAAHIFLAQRQSNGPAYEVIDDAGHGTSGYVYTYSTAQKQTDPMFYVHHDTSSWTSGAVFHIEAQQGSGTFTANPFYYKLGSNEKFKVAYDGSVTMVFLYGETQTQGNPDTVYLGANNTSNFFFDRSGTGSGGSNGINFNYNTSRVSGSSSYPTVTFFDNSTNRNTMMQIISQAASGGASGVTLNSLPTTCTGQPSKAIYNTTTSAASGGGTLLGVCP
jgi:hypothetical protein